MGVGPGAIGEPNRISIPLSDPEVARLCYPVFGNHREQGEREPGPTGGEFNLHRRANRQQAHRGRLLRCNAIGHVRVPISPNVPREGPPGNRTICCRPTISTWYHIAIDRQTASELRSGLLGTAAGIAQVRGLHALLRGAPPGRYVLHAAIASLYAEAPSYDQTDWPQIVALYDKLLDVRPSPVVELNRAVPLAMVAGPETALTEIEK